MSHESNVLDEEGRLALACEEGVVSMPTVIEGVEIPPSSMANLFFTAWDRIMSLPVTILDRLTIVMWILFAITPPARRMSHALFRRYAYGVSQTNPAAFFLLLVLVSQAAMPAEALVGFDQCPVEYLHEDVYESLSWLKSGAQHSYYDDYPWLSSAPRFQQSGMDCLCDRPDEETLSWSKLLADAWLLVGRAVSGVDFVAILDFRPTVWQIVLAWFGYEALLTFWGWIRQIKLWRIRVAKDAKQPETQEPVVDSWKPDLSKVKSLEMAVPSSQLFATEQEFHALKMYHLESKNSMRFVGTCSAIQSAGRTFLLTAAHCLSALSPNPEDPHWLVLELVGHRGHRWRGEFQILRLFRLAGEDVALAEVDTATFDSKMAECGSLTKMRKRVVHNFSRSARLDSGVIYGFEDETGRQFQSTGIVTSDVERKYGLHHQMSTKPGFSGAPIVSYGSLVGIHLGADPAVEQVRDIQTVRPRNYGVSAKLIERFLMVVVNRAEESPMPEERDQFEILSSGDFLREYGLYATYDTSGSTTGNWADDTEFVYHNVIDAKVAEAPIKAAAVKVVKSVVPEGVVFPNAGQDGPRKENPSTSEAGNQNSGSTQKTLDSIQPSGPRQSAKGKKRSPSGDTSVLPSKPKSERKEESPQEPDFVSMLKAMQSLSCKLQNAMELRSRDQSGH